MDDLTPLEHLEYCEDALDDLNGRPIKVYTNKVCIYATSAEDAKQVYRNLKTVLGTDGAASWTEDVLNDVLKAERSEWNLLRWNLKNKVMKLLTF